MQTHEGPARSLVAVPTELHRLKHSRRSLRSSGVLRGVEPSQMDRIGCPETSVTHYQPMPLLQSRRLQQHCGGRRKEETCTQPKETREIIYLEEDKKKPPFPTAHCRLHNESSGPLSIHYPCHTEYHKTQTKEFLPLTQLI